MSQELSSTNQIDLALNLPSAEGVCYNPDTISLQGVYLDELSLFRAKKQWSDTLSTSFLLDLGRDFDFNIVRDYEGGKFVLGCQFMTACGRYAFWRLTNDQAPEAQYEVETAHIPDSPSHHDQFVSAPDMKSIHDSPLVTTGLGQDDNNTFSQWLHEIVKRIAKSF